VEILRCESTELPELVERTDSDVVINAAVSYGRNEVMSAVVETNTLLPVQLAESLTKKPDALFMHTDTFFAKAPPSYEYLAAYRETKRSAVTLLRMLDSKLKIVNMRLEHLYGPYDEPQKFIPHMVQAIVAGISPVALTSGTQRRDLIHVRDAARACRCIIEGISSLSSGFTTLEVGSGESRTIRSIVEQIKALSGSASELRFGAVPDRIGEIPMSVANLTQLSALGWAPKEELSSGLQELIALVQTAS
jgi:nucleoside-diphosphate-sugar epimerase